MTTFGARLALHGGPRAVTLDATEANRWPILGEEDEAAVLEVLRDGDLSLHGVTKALEDDFRRYLGVEHALAHCNGTAALLAAFYAIGLQRGDEVLVPSATHWASVVPMLWVGALPIFCETEPRRLGLDPEDVRPKITSRTKAMVVVHLWGMPSRMTELLEIAARHGLKVIEDASHAIGGSWRGRKCGTLGDISVISLQTQKLAPAGEGGMLLTGNREYYEQAIALGDVMRILELGPEHPLYRLAGTSMGIKTRIAPLSAAVARVQLRHLDERNRRRNANLAHLSRRLEALGFDTFLPPEHVERTYFEFLIRCDETRIGLPMATLIEALQAEGCQAAPPRYPLLHQQPLFTEGLCFEIAGVRGRDDLPTYRPDALPRTEAMNAQAIKLPSFPSAERELLDQYAVAFEKVMAWADGHRPRQEGS